MQKFSSVRVLLVEDNEVNQQVVSYQLTSLGCHIKVVNDGYEALKTLEEEDYDLILMDCQLPGLSGYDTTIKIRERELQLSRFPLYIVALTAHALEGDRQKCLNAGMDDYLSKPLKLTVLEAAFHRWQNRNQQAPDLEAPVHPNLGQVVDPVAIVDLKNFAGSGDVFAELVHLFLRDSSRYFEAILQAIEQRDGPALKQHAHKLAGSCTHFGAHSLLQICADLGLSGQNGDHKRASEQLAVLKEHLDVLHRALKQTTGLGNSGAGESRNQH